MMNVCIDANSPLLLDSDAEIAANCPLLKKDVYKVGHKPQYEEGTQEICSNITARTSRIPGVNRIVVVGLQKAIIQHLMVDMKRWFFDIEKTRMMRIYRTVVEGILGPGADISHIEALHDLGYMPLKIRAAKEGTHSNLRVPFFIIRNTLPKFYWLTNDVETLLSSETWGPITSATTAARYYDIATKWAKLTGSPMDFIQWQNHDFSARGMMGTEAARMSGMGHLVCFTGSDTIVAGTGINLYYQNANYAKPTFVMGSVAATEHSVSMTSGEAHEEETLVRLLTKTYPSGILSFVSDTWNLWRVITEYLPRNKDIILARNGKLVIRPDSGDPVNILCGNPDAPAGSPEYKGVIELLWEIFGGTTNELQFKFLDSHIGAIYGDAITPERAEAIFARLAAKGFGSSNVVLGIGSYTYQYVTRDTYGLAVKSTFAVVNGEERSLEKRPITDNGIKNSAIGRLAVRNGELIQNATAEDEANCELPVIFENGCLKIYYSWEDVRNNFKNTH